MPRSWYEDWFADEHYLALYTHRNTEDASNALDRIEHSTRLSKDAAILDLACGAGRHSICLARRGYTNITAIDLSPTLLREGEETAKKEGVKIVFRKQDIRNFSGTYDLIMNLFTSIGYFESDEENEEVIVRSGRHLYPGGYFVLDFLNASALKKNLVPYTVKFLDGGEKVEMFRSIEHDRVEKKILIHAAAGRKEFYESVRLFTRDDFERMFMKAGITITDIFGDYFGSPFDEGSSPRLFLVGKV